MLKLDGHNLVILRYAVERKEKHLGPTCNDTSEKWNKGAEWKEEGEDKHKGRGT